MIFIFFNIIYSARYRIDVGVGSLVFVASCMLLGVRMAAAAAGAGARARLVRANSIHVQSLPTGRQPQGRAGPVHNQPYPSRQHQPQPSERSDDSNVVETFA